MQTIHFTKSKTEQFIQLIKSQKKIGIICHAKPDADAIGALTGLQTFIKIISKKTPNIYCTDNTPNNLNFLNSKQSHTNQLSLQDIDTLIFVDCSSADITRLPKQTLQKLNTIQTICIDHHISNNNFADQNYVFPKSSSTTEAITELFINSSIKIYPQTATQLLAGIYFDTGSLMHSNTTSHTLKIAQHLLKQKADLKKITKQLFKQTTTNQLKLYGKVIQKSYLNQKQVLSSSITNQELKELNCTSHDLNGSIDLLNKVPNKKLTVLLHENEHNQIKASMRTQQKKQDLSKIAKLFQGGGHSQAAGFSVKGKIQNKTQIL